MTTDDRKFVIESPTRITLGPEAKELARQQGMSLEDMAKHLLQQDRLRQTGDTQREGEN
jgi:hypothetical protein